MDHRRLAPESRLDRVDGATWALILEGDARLESTAGVESLHAGDAFYVDFRTAYRFVAVTEVEITVATLRAVSPLPSPLVARDFVARHRGVAELVRICPLEAECRQSLFASSYGGLIHAAMTQAHDEAQQQGSDPQVAAVVTMLESRPGHRWTVERMAQLAHLSRSTLGERFRRELGRTPAQVLREVRMQHARHLLAATAKPVEQVALAVGYGSTAAFSRAFSAHHGLSPQAWRSHPRRP